MADDRQVPGGDDDDIADEERPPLELSLLSEREREVFGVAVEGLTAREIADQLSLTEATIRSHLSVIYAKLDVTGRVELLARLNGRLARRHVPEIVPAAVQPERLVVPAGLGERR